MVIKCLTWLFGKTGVDPFHIFYFVCFFMWIVCQLFDIFYCLDLAFTVVKYTVVHDTINSWYCFKKKVTVKGK